MAEDGGDTDADTVNEQSKAQEISTLTTLPGLIAQW